MADPKTDEIRQWMQKAHHDLLTAAQVLELDQPLTDIAAYHCQQAAEKALKVYLVQQDTPFSKTHAFPGIGPNRCRMNLKDTRAPLITRHTREGGYPDRCCYSVPTCAGTTIHRLPPP